MPCLGPVHKRLHLLIPSPYAGPVERSWGRPSHWMEDARSLSDHVDDCDSAGMSTEDFASEKQVFIVSSHWYFKVHYHSRSYLPSPPFFSLLASLWLWAVDISLLYNSSSLGFLDATHHGFPTPVSMAPTTLQIKPKILSLVELSARRSHHTPSHPVCFPKHTMLSFTLWVCICCSLCLKYCSH